MMHCLQRLGRPAGGVLSSLLNISHRSLSTVQQSNIGYVRLVFNCGADDHLALRARVFDTPTSRAFIDGCPHQIPSLHAYGDEVYGSLRHALPQHKAQPIIPPGGIAYSAQGQYLCIFFGQRPAWAVDYIAQIEVGYEYLQGRKWRDLVVTREDPLAMESY